MRWARTASLSVRTSGQGQNAVEAALIQDCVRYQLTKAHGVVSVVLPIGGRDHQATVDPVELRLRHSADEGRAGHPRLRTATSADRALCRDGRKPSTWYAAGYRRGGERHRGLLVVKSDKGAASRSATSAASVSCPTHARADLNSTAKAKLGIVMSRYGQNALEVISSQGKDRREIGPGLPKASACTPFMTAPN